MIETEQQALEQLTNYRKIAARIKLLENYSLGAGITVSRLNQDDQLQDLHRRLRGMPSYMYLNKHEQRLEATAHAYLTEYRAGTRSQLLAIPKQGADLEDEKLLRELRHKIGKVIEARAGHMNDYDAVLERISELQDLQAEKLRIDNVLDALEAYKPEYAELLRLRFTVGKLPQEVADDLGIAPRTFRKWQSSALAEYEKLISS